jgi:hypothetical protein
VTMYCCISASRLNSSTIPVKVIIKLQNCAGLRYNTPFLFAGNWDAHEVGCQKESEIADEGLELELNATRLKPTVYSTCGRVLVRGLEMFQPSPESFSEDFRRRSNILDNSCLVSVLHLPAGYLKRRRGINGRVLER